MQFSEQEKEIAVRTSVINNYTTNFYAEVSNTQCNKVQTILSKHKVSDNSEIVNCQSDSSCLLSPSNINPAIPLRRK